MASVLPYVVLLLGQLTAILGAKVKAEVKTPVKDTWPAQKCEEIRIPFCSDFDLYHLAGVAFPNIAHQRSQHQVMSSLKRYHRLLEVPHCRKPLKELLCAAYLPICTKRRPQPLLPCRSMCTRTMAACRAAVQETKHRWPTELSCSRLPATDCLHFGSGVTNVRRLIEMESHDKKHSPGKQPAKPANEKHMVSVAVRTHIPHDTPKPHSVVTKATPPKPKVTAHVTKKTPLSTKSSHVSKAAQSGTSTRTSSAHPTVKIAILDDMDTLREIEEPTQHTIKNTQLTSKNNTGSKTTRNSSKPVSHHVTRTVAPNSKESGAKTTVKPAAKPTASSPSRSKAALQNILPRRYDMHERGNPYYFQGWADVQGQGAANDYCRLVGTNPKQWFLSCALAGGKEHVHNYVSKRGFNPGHMNSWFMRDMDEDGRDDYCRCVYYGKGSKIKCMKAGPNGFYGSPKQPGSEMTFEVRTHAPCHGTKLNPFLGL